jgi:hypothetical protein
LEFPLLLLLLLLVVVVVAVAAAAAAAAAVVVVVVVVVVFTMHLASSPEASCGSSSTSLHLSWLVLRFSFPEHGSASSSWEFCFWA